LRKDGAGDFDCIKITSTILSQNMSLPLTS
jgi:hypothetical protein